MTIHSPVLAISPHIDDIEFGLGATIAKLAELGVEVHILTMSNSEISLREELPPDTLVSESILSSSVLGVPKSNIKRFNFPTRYFHEHRQSILEEFVVIRNELRPSCVFTPCKDDVHQDHTVVTNEVVRAFKNSTILGYELPWNHYRSNLSVYVKITEAELIKKQKAISCFASQSSRIYADSHSIRSLAVIRGMQINESFAEAFEAIRIVIRS